MRIHSSGVVMLMSFLSCSICAQCSPIPLRCAIISSDEGSILMSKETVSNKITEVNRIFRQVAMSFEITYCICTNDMTLTDVSKTNVRQRERLYSMIPNGDGLKLFFVNSIMDDAVAFWNPFGIIIEKSATSKDVAHEIGHACGLEDIYSECVGSNFVIEVSGPISKARMPDDWGRYSSDADQRDFVKRLLMYGADDGDGLDISYGDVDGVWQDAANVDVAYVNSNCWHTSLAPVGFHYHGNRHPRSDDWVED